MLGPYILDNVPFLEEAVRVRRMTANVLRTETAMAIGGMYVEPSFLRMFSYPLEHGDPNGALIDPFTIVISQETARRFFGSDDPIHQTLTLENLGDFKITGILKKVDLRSHFSTFDVLFQGAHIWGA